MKEADEFEVWETVRGFYKEKFGIAPELVDIASVFDLLKLCASGASNKSISKFYNEPEESLKEVFDTYLGFMGWEEDLPFSPLRLFKELDFPDRGKFIDEVTIRYGYDKVHTGFDEMYESARLVERLERLFNEQWI